MSDNPPPSKASRIAIKFGAPSSAGSRSSSNATNRREQSKPSSALGKRQRTNAFHNDAGSGEDDEVQGKHEAITAVGSETRSSRDSNAPADKRRDNKYVIGSQKNRDWKADVKSRKGDKVATPQTSAANDHKPETAPADQDRDIKWGLNVTQKSKDGDTSSPHEKLEHGEKDTADVPIASPQSPKDADKDAIDALLGKRKPAQDLVIKGSAASSKPQFSEQDAYQRSMRDAADISTIEEYSEIPEGEFGAAMLRGMGWKGEEFGSKPKEVKRRPHLMGLGSKEDEEIRKAEQAKRHGYRDHRPRLDEYRRDREKEKQEQGGRHGESYKSERERERREQHHGHRHRSRHHDRDDRGYR